jgi:hypothetical protein
MTRAIAEEALLFLAPFALFALYLVVRRRNPLRWMHWSDHTIYLAIAGLVCAVAALIVTGLTAERRSGGFEPTHMENGRLVPGRFK